MRILITGGAGYLGSMVTAYALSAGYQVTVLDTFEHGVYSLSSMISNPQLRVVRGDCRRVPDDLLRDHDAIFPLAAIVGQRACDARQDDADTINVGAIRDLIDRTSREQAVVFPCTNSGYGIGEKGQMCTEKTPLRPLSLYGVTKVRAEMIVVERGGVSLRLATLHGWSMRMRRDLLVNDLTWRAVRDGGALIYEGGARRNFCHVRDAAAAFVTVLQSHKLGEIYNVGDTSANMTKLQLCAKIQDHVPRFRFLAADVSSDPDKRDYLVSNEKIETELGWRPRYSLDQGIAELIRGYQMMSAEEHGNA